MSEQPWPNHIVTLVDLSLPVIAAPLVSYPGHHLSCHFQQRDASPVVTYLLRSPFLGTGMSMASDQSLGTDCSSHTVCTRSSKIVYNVNTALQPPTFTISGSMQELSPALPLFLRLHSTLSWWVSLLALV